MICLCCINSGFEIFFSGRHFLASDGLQQKKFLVNNSLISIFREKHPAYRPWQIKYKHMWHTQNYKLYTWPNLIIFYQAHSWIHLFSFLSMWSDLNKLTVKSDMYVRFNVSHFIVHFLFLMAWNLITVSRNNLKCNH